MDGKIRVAVIGAGVNGLGSALAILRANSDVILTVYSGNFTPNTTGDGSAGFWSPYVVVGTSDDAVNKWSKATWDFMEEGFKMKKFGVVKVEALKVSKNEIPLPSWKSIPGDMKPLTARELKRYGHEYSFGYSHSSFVCQPVHLLPELMAMIQDLGGRFARRKIESLEDLSSEVDIIVNCSGIGSRELVPDANVHPVRGQIMRVVNCPIRKVTFDLSDDTPCYVIPNLGNVVLGGTYQVDDWSTTLSSRDRNYILENTLRLEPSLQNCEIIEEWVGLRPARKGGVRLEEDFVYAKNGKKIPVVHNYGHGGSGVTMFWGCSIEVSNLVGKIVNRINKPTFSKL